MFDKKKFFKEIKTFTLIALFIFLLAAINLFAKTNDQILATSSMEMSGYVGVYNDKYNESYEQAANELRQIEQILESDSSADYKKQFFILDKTTNEIIATGDVSAQVQNELNAQVNEKMIVIDSQACKIVDFDHYKLLVKVDSLAAFNEFLDAIANYALVALATLLFAFVLIALGQMLGGKRESLRLGINIAITLVVVAGFAFEVFQAETKQLNSIAAGDKETLIADLNSLTHSSLIANDLTKENIETIGNSLAKASVTLKDVVYVGQSSQVANESLSSNFNAAQDVQVSTDDGKVQNERTSFFIQAALLMLLAFILAKEAADRTKAAAKAKRAGGASLTKNDQQVRIILLLVGLTTSCFGIVNVLRIRQVVMMNFQGDVGAIIGAVFTAAMVMTIVGSFVSSAILKRCGSLKMYVAIVCGIGIVGSVACGISNNIAVFVAGLLMYNVAHATSRASDDFYITLIDDAARKDRCGVEFSASKAIGEIVGTIAGGVISVVVSFAFVQLLVGALFFITVVYALRLNGKAFAVKASKNDSLKDTLLSTFKAAKHPNVVMYMVLVAMMCSIPYMLIQYKLPLDIASVGLSAVVLSFIMTLHEVVEIYSRPLFHIVSKRVSAVGHAVLYAALGGVVILIYMMCETSFFVMCVSLALLGLLNGAGKYAPTKAFRELPELSSMPESDRIVALRMSQKLGDTISPSLLSAFSTGPVLPIVVTVLPIIYWLKGKFLKQKK